MALETLPHRLVLRLASQCLRDIERIGARIAIEDDRARSAPACRIPDRAGAEAVAAEGDGLFGSGELGLALRLECPRDVNDAATEDGIRSGGSRIVGSRQKQIDDLGT